MLIFVQLQVYENYKAWNACTICTVHWQWTYIKVLLDKILAAQLVKFPLFDINWRFTTIFKLARHWANICMCLTLPQFDMTHAYHATSFNYPIQVSIAQIMKLITQFSPVSWHFLLLWCKYAHHHIPNQICNLSLPWPTMFLTPLVFIFI